MYLCRILYLFIFFTYFCFRCLLLLFSRVYDFPFLVTCVFESGFVPAIIINFQKEHEKMWETCHQCFLGLVSCFCLLNFFFHFVLLLCQDYRCCRLHSLFSVFLYYWWKQCFHPRTNDFCFFFPIFLFPLFFRKSFCIFYTNGLHFSR